ncbi:ACN9-domain-containing protein [Ascodesmis nigricans]|uniref:Succinate dehydrogenase assembly factor 3 n=1 Tax=Ascodesmis nigricans TaxID=341454 RepID=A0A4S2MZU6_9PEZI|nr:ACN9-domain-containing protein [Ascodesmis nigricans]
MRASLHRLATHTTRSRSITSRPPALALLPPIQLYRRVLRCHRKFLPVDKRLLGDEFVKSEFRRHKDIDNPVHIVGFLTEWQSYVKQLEDGNWMQGNLDMEKLEKMSDEQIQQLYDLMLAAKGEQVEGYEDAGEAAPGSKTSGGEGSEKA